MPDRLHNSVMHETMAVLAACGDARGLAPLAPLAPLAVVCFTLGHCVHIGRIKGHKSFTTDSTMHRAADDELRVSAFWFQTLSTMTNTGTHYKVHIKMFSTIKPRATMIRSTNNVNATTAPTFTLCI